MTHADAARRRAEIAAYAEQHGVAAAVEHFQATSHAVYEALKRTGSSAGQVKVPTTAFDVLARLLKGEQQSDIARELRITKQRVSQVACAAEQAGIALPGRPQPR